MRDQEKLNGKTPSRSFKASSLKLDPSLIAIACYLARITADDDYDAFKKEQESYNSSEQMKGPS